MSSVTLDSSQPSKLSAGTAMAYQIAALNGLAEGMGGGVEAGPSPLGGLRIVVELPVAATPPADAASAPGSEPTAGAQAAAGPGPEPARTPR